MAAPEAPLWALLDSIDLPFRDTLGALTDRFGTQADPLADGARLCRLPTSWPGPGQGQFDIRLSPGDDPTLPPFELQLSYRRSRRRAPTDWLIDRRAERSHAQISRRLTQALGAGADVSTANALAREWRFGMARIAAVAFPPRRNRRFVVSGRGGAGGWCVECLITLNPGWLPPLTQQELSWLVGFDRIGQPVPPASGKWWPPARWHRWPAAAGLPPPAGYGISRDGRGVVVAWADQVLAISAADVLALTRQVLHPARGSGSVELVLTHAPFGVAGVRPHSLVLARASHSDTALLAEGRALAAALGRDLHETVGLDD